MSTAAHAASARIIDRLNTHTPDGRPYRFAFICGHMRSGTNWVGNILRSHPDVAVHGEGPFGLVCGAIVQAKHQAWLYSSRDERIAQVLDESFAELVRNCMLQLATLEPERSVVVDSTSRQVWPYLPGTHHIHIMRDPRDVLISWTLHQLANRLAIGEPWSTRLSGHLQKFELDPNYFTKYPHELLSDEAWVRFVCRGWWEFMYTANEVREKHADGRLNLKLHEIRYEHMMQHDQAEADRLFRFLDLDPERAAKLSGQNFTAAGASHNDPRSHFRSGKVGDWQKYMTDDARRWIKEAVGEMMIQTGYEQDAMW